MLLVAHVNIKSAGTVPNHQSIKLRYITVMIRSATDYCHLKRRRQRCLMIFDGMLLTVSMQRDISVDACSGSLTDVQNCVMMHLNYFSRRMQETALFRQWFILNQSMRSGLVDGDCFNFVFGENREIEDNGAE